ncbi:hypothetical protein L292_2172 [Acinetobacter junii CIP 107470 = MTCC 11364]|uniref:Uncharacterized protein n=1 Tax=Acinetobacter junii CIP 107470 = MTCC 11364 TaxID=1217666 RepID=S7Y6P2_ACIJU|nr:hypothetical protein L292_2172 [Acinetobacter junii CIP 107470 = MTCC 11364]
MYSESSGDLYKKLRNKIYMNYSISIRIATILGFNSHYWKA